MLRDVLCDVISDMVWGGMWGGVCWTGTAPAAHDWRPG